MIEKKNIVKRIKNWLIRHFTGRAYEALPEAGDRVLSFYVDPTRELAAIMAPLQDMANQLDAYCDRVGMDILNHEMRLEHMRQTSSRAQVTLSNMATYMGIEAENAGPTVELEAPPDDK